tara:strand:+ start:595 stop:1032 length:438 start_codon:yes stop_codon:yes gene_type:complete
MLWTSLLSYSLIFGAFGTDICLPLKRGVSSFNIDKIECGVVQPTNINDDIDFYSGKIVPTKKLGFIACFDEQLDTIHYFIHDNYTLYRSLWGNSMMTHDDKALIFYKLRKFYLRNCDSTSIVSTAVFEEIDLTNEEDMSAWKRLL